MHTNAHTHAHQCTHCRPAPCNHTQENTPPIRTVGSWCSHAFDFAVHYYHGRYYHAMPGTDPLYCAVCTRSGSRSRARCAGALSARRSSSSATAATSGPFPPSYPIFSTSSYAILQFCAVLLCHFFILFRHFFKKSPTPFCTIFLRHLALSSYFFPCTIFPCYFEAILLYNFCNIPRCHFFSLSPYAAPRRFPYTSSSVDATY